MAQHLSVTRKDHGIYKYAMEVCGRLKGNGVHSSNRMLTAGFQYTGDGDTARCTCCSLEISGWTGEMNPFRIHLERNPQCPFVRSIQSNNESTLIETESCAKRRKPFSNVEQRYEEKQLMELANLKQVRRRTFSHWPQQMISTRDQLIEAGFFQCNVGDRVICIYCNLICQQWNKDTDDPVEVHKTLSPQCPYVQLVLNSLRASPVVIINEVSADNASNQETLLDSVSRLQSNHVVHTSPCHALLKSVIDRQATFDTWTAQSPPSVDDLVRAGFFYTGTKSIVTCFYCNGSLQNWGKNDNPLIEHIRWFPTCPYAKQLSGDELHNRIRTTLQERENAKSLANATENTSTTNNQQSPITDERLLSRIVAARLDLPISQRLLSRNFKLSIIKRCWEDQILLKRDDFVSDCDLYIACVILQKQVEYINGNKDNIIIPSRKMKSLQHNDQPNNLAAQQSSSTPPPTSLPTSVPKARTITTARDETIPQATAVVNNPCLLCCKEEKRLACIPCGHLAICVHCSQTLRTCPVCYRGVEAFVRVYI